MTESFNTRLHWKRKNLDRHYRQKYGVVMGADIFIFTKVLTPGVALAAYYHINIVIKITMVQRERQLNYSLLIYVITTFLQ